jgi:hypothetical protein
VTRIDAFPKLLAAGAGREMLRYSLFFLALVVLGAVLFVLRLRRALRKAAEGIFQIAYGMYSGRHDWQVASAADFSGLNLEFYAQTQAALGQLGFSLLGDLENLTVQQVIKAPRTFLRIMVGPDQAAVAAFYDLLRPVVRREAGRAVQTIQSTRMLELETYLSNDTSVSTGPLCDAIMQEDTPGNLRFFVPPGTAPERLLARHQAHVTNVLGRHAGVVPVPVTSLPAVVELMHHSHDRTVAYRQRIGFITDDEFDRHSASLPHWARRRIKAELVRLRVRYQRATQTPTAG